MLRLSCTHNREPHQEGRDLVRFHFSTQIYGSVSCVGGSLQQTQNHVFFDDGTVEFLVLKAEGRVVHPLRISSSPIYLKETGATARAIIETEQFDQERPPTPLFTVPEGVVIKSTRWKLKSKLKPRSKIPAIWTMEIELESDREMTSGDELKIIVGEEKMHVPLEQYSSSSEEGDSIRFMPVQ